MFNIKRFGAAAMAVLMVLSIFGMAFAGGAAATTAESDYQLDGEDLVEGFEAADADNDTVIYETTAESDGADDFDELTLEITYDDNTLVEYDVDDADVTGDDDDTTPLELEWTVEHADLEQLPGDAGEITVADAMITELETGDEAEAVETDGEIEYEFANTYAAITVFDADDDAFATFDTEDKWFGLAESTDLSFDESVGVDGDNTTIHAHVADEDMADEFDETAEDRDDGDMLGAMMTSSVDGEDITYVFANEPGEKFGGDEVDADEDTYIVYNDDTSAFEVNLGSDNVDENQDTVDVNVVGLETPGFGDLTSSLDAGWMDAASFSVSSMLDSLNPF